MSGGAATVEGRVKVLGRYAPENLVPASERDDPEHDWLPEFQEMLAEEGRLELTWRKRYLVSPTPQRQSIIVRDHSWVRGNGATVVLDPEASLWEAPGADRGFIFGTMPDRPVTNCVIEGLNADLGGHTNRHDITLRFCSLTGHEVVVRGCRIRGFRAGTRAECFVIWTVPSWRRAWTDVVGNVCQEAAPNRHLWAANEPPQGWVPELSLLGGSNVRDNRTLVVQDEEQVAPIHHIVPVGGFGCSYSGNVCRYKGRSRLLWVQRPDEGGWWTELHDGGGNAHIEVT